MVSRGKLRPIEKPMHTKPRGLVIAVLVCGGAFCSLLALGQISPPHDSVWDQQMQDAYSRHFAKIQHMLSAHSALPPLLDLTKAKIDDSGRDRAWEKRYDLAVRKGGIVDPGVRTPLHATSTAVTFIDTVGRPYALPARSCEAVVIGEPIANEVRISRNRHFVHSRFSVRVQSDATVQNVGARIGAERRTARAQPNLPGVAHE